MDNISVLLQIRRPVISVHAVSGDKYMYTCTHSMLKKGGIKSLKIICKKMIKKDLITLKKISFFLRENLAIKMKQVLVNIHMYYQTNIKNPHSSVSIYNHKQPHRELL